VDSSAVLRTIGIALIVLVVAFGALYMTVLSRTPALPVEPQIIRGARLMRCPDGGASGGVYNRPPWPEHDQELTPAATRPEILRKSAPRFTRDAWERCVSGVVVAELLIDAQGKVEDGRLLKGLPYGLNEAAAKEVLRWEYRPARSGDQPVKAAMVVHIRFNPNDESQRPAE
jgi:TonB family protein